MRPEKANKSNILGFIGVLPHADLYVPDISSPVEKLTFLFILDKGAGMARLVLKLFTPSGLNMLPPTPPFSIHTSDLLRTPFGVSVQGVRFDAEGDYRVELTSEDEIVFNSEFCVRRGTAEDALKQLAESRNDPQVRV